jgi:hypothetical protein
MVLGTCVGRVRALLELHWFMADKLREAVQAGFSRSSA